MNFPNINPVLLDFGYIRVRWYSLAYIFGIILSWFLINHFNNDRKVFEKEKICDDFFLYGVISIIIGGRLFYVIFYNLHYYILHPYDILKIWNGGMSFHGGFVGVLIGSYLLCKKYNIKFISFLDLLSITTPIGLFMGRIANFINSELYGRVTQSKFGIIFPNAGSLPRHPSQLYEAFLEGFVLFILLFILNKKTDIKKYEGFSSGLFLIFYGLSRFFVEFFREPDIQLGFILKYFTMGQILTIPFFIFGAILINNSLIKTEKKLYKINFLNIKK